MLRVGLTGGLASGKSTAARRFAELGAHVLYADDIARGLMQPGEAVYQQIVERFGPGILADGGQIDRAALARVAFGEGRIEELNAIVHPATVARQAELIAEIAARDRDAVVMVESALIFETKHGGETRRGGEKGWQSRFDCIILVRAAQETRVARFVARGPRDAQSELEEDARRRMAQQLDDDWKAERSDYVITNDGTVENLIAQVDAIWPQLQEKARGR